MISIKKLFLAAALLYAGDSSLQAVNYTWTNAASTNWLVAANWDPNGVPGPSDTANIGGAMRVTVSNPGIDTLCGTLNLSGNASLNGGTGLTVGAGLNFTGGTLSGKVTIETTATMLISNASPVTLSAGPLLNLGIVQCQATSLQAPAGSVISNQASWIFQTNTAVNSSGAGAIFYNAASGAITCSGQSGTATLSTVQLINSGTVEVDGGTLTLAGGGWMDGTFTASAGTKILLSGGSFTNAKATFTGAGLSQLGGGNLYLTNDVSPNLRLAGGFVHLGPQFQNNGAITSLTIAGSALVGTNVVTGTLNWWAGSITGVLTVTNNATLAISGSSFVNQGAVITNLAKTLWNGSGNWNLNDGSAFYNLGTGLIDIQYDGVMNATGSGVMINAGVFKKSAGQGTTTIYAPMTNSGAIAVYSGTVIFRGGGNFGGTVSAANGTEIEFASAGGALTGTFTAGYAGSVQFAQGTFLVGSSAVFGGLGLCEQTGGTMTLPDNPPANLKFAGGQVNLPPTFQGGVISNLTMTNGEALNGSNYVTGVLNFAGTFNGPLIVANGGVLNLVGGSTGFGQQLTVQAGGTVNVAGTGAYFAAGVSNMGTMNWSGGYMQLQYNSGFYNGPGAAFNIFSNGDFDDYYGYEVFTNYGTLRKYGSPGTQYFSPALLNNGSVEVDSGTLDFEAAGVEAILAGQILATGGGRILFNDGGELAGAFTAGPGGTIDLSGGAFDLTSAAFFSGAGTNIMTGGTLVLSSDHVPGLVLAGGTFTLTNTFQGGIITNLSINGSLAGSNYLDGTLTISGNIGQLGMSPRAVLNWSGGSLTAPLTIPLGAIVNFTGPDYLLMYASVTNYGTFNWSGENGIDIEGAYSFNNLQGAVFNINCDETLSGSYYYYNSVFNNAGEIHKFGTAGEASIQALFNNLGRVDVDSGDLQFYPYNYDAASGSLGGLFHSSPGAAIEFANGGELSGIYSNELGGTLNLTGGTFTNLPGSVFTGAGSNILSGGYITLDTTTIPGLNIDGQAYVTLGPDFQEGTITNLTLAANLQGSNIVTGTLTLTGGSWMGPLSVLQGGLVNLSPSLNTSLQSSYPITVYGEAVLNIGGNGYTELLGGLTNFGTVNWTSGVIETGSLPLENEGLFNIVCDESLEPNSYYYYYDAGPFLNDGTVIKKVTSGNTSISTPFENSGTVDVQTGILDIGGYYGYYYHASPVLGGSMSAENNATLRFSGGGLLSGTFDAAPGGLIDLEDGNFTNTAATVFTGAGVEQLSYGTFYLTTNVYNLQFNGGDVIPSGFDLSSLSSLTLNNATLIGSNTINGTLSLTGNLEGTLIVNGTLNFSGMVNSGTSLVLGPSATLNWNSGYLYTALTIPAAATVNIYGYFNANSPMTNFGTVNWYGGSMDIYNGANFYNQAGAKFEIFTSQTFYNSFLGETFFNSGLVQKTGTTGGGSFNPPFNNSGTLDIETGWITFANGVIDNNAAWVFGINSATNFGQAIVSKPLTLNGSLSVNVNGNYQVALSNAYTLVLMSAGQSLNGAFSGLSVAPPEDGAYHVVYTTTSASIQATNVSRPAVTITSPANLQILAAPASPTITVTAPGANSVQFFANGSLIGAASGSSPFTYHWASVPAGAYVLTATASDTQGAVVNSASAVTIFVTPQNSKGKNYNWTGASSANWNDSGNWTPSGVPTALDSVLINVPGAINVPSGTVVNSMVLESGALGGSGSLTVVSNLVWVGGGLNVQTVISPSATMLIVGQGPFDLSGAELINAGTTLWRSGNITGDSSASMIVNSGTWIAQGNNILTNLTQFANAGFFYKTNGSGTTLINVPFDTTGYVETDRGILRFTAGGDMNGPFKTSAGATAAFSAPGNGEFGFISDTNWAFSGAGTNVLGDMGWVPLTGVLNIPTNLQLLYGSDITLSPDFQDHGAITNLTFEGSLEGTNIVTGVMTFEGGYIEGPLTVSNGAVVNLAAVSLYDLNFDSDFIINGQVAWNSGDISGQVITNKGTLFVNCDNGLSGEILVNAGMIQKLAGTGMTILYPPVVNDGTIDAESGMIKLEGSSALTGTYEANTNAFVNFYGANFTIDTLPEILGSGTVEFTAGQLTVNSDFPQQLTLAGGQVVLGPNFQDHGGITNLKFAGADLQGNNTVKNTLVWNGGSVDGGLTILSNATLIIGQGRTLEVDSGGITNFGTILNYGEVYLGAGTMVVNNGLFVAEQQSEVYGSSLVNAAEFTNNSTFLVDAQSDYDASINTPFYNQGEIHAVTGRLYLYDGGPLTGAYNAEAGAAILLEGGNFVANDQPVIKGLGTTELDGATLTLLKNPITGLYLYEGSIALGAAFEGTGNISSLSLSNYCRLLGTNTVTGSFQWEGGSVAGPLIIDSTGELDITNTDYSCYFYGPGLTNHGIVKLNGYLYMESLGVIDNEGTWTALGYGTIGNDSVNSGFINHGLLQVQSPYQTFNMSIAFTNNGVVDVQSGTTEFSYGGLLTGTYNAAPSTTVTFSANYSNPWIVGDQPTFTGSGTFSFASGNLLLLNDAVPGLELTGGLIEFGPNFQDHGAITNLTLEGAELQGTNTVTGSLTVFDQYYNYIVAPLVIASGGTLNLTNASGYYTEVEAWIVNYGTVNWGGRTLYVSGGVNITNYGVWVCTGDDALNNSGSAFYNFGVFRKAGTTGTTTVEEGSFINSGTLEADTGTIAMGSEGYGQTGANLAFAASAETIHGRLVLDTNLNIDGTLTILFTNGYAPNIGDTLPLISYPSQAGGFAGYNLPVLPSGMDWQVDVRPQATSARIVASLAADNTLKVSGTVTDSKGHPIPGVTVYATADGSDANLIVNGGFEMPANPNNGYVLYPSGSTNVTGWTVVGPAGDNIAIHGSYIGTVLDGSQYFDPSGQTGGAGISQTFPTTAGASYVVVFYHGSYSRGGYSPAINVTIAGNVYPFGETSSDNGFDWREEVIPFTATSSATTLTFSDATGVNADDGFIDDVQVFPPDSGRALEATTDSNGQYSIALANGAFEVGVAGLEAAGYGPVEPESVTMGGKDQTANFVAPAQGGGQVTISTTTFPPGIGTATGGGTVERGSVVTVTAAITNKAKPYLFAGWYDNGVLESTNAIYTFAAAGDTPLVAQFKLATFTVYAYNNPSDGGTITGLIPGYSYTNADYGSIVILTAFPNYPYKFVGWTEGADTAGTTLSLTNVVTTNHTFYANYVTTNYTHFVGADTAPTGLTTNIIGAFRGYNNGQAAYFSAPTYITNGANYYTFQYMAVSGFYGSYYTYNNSFNWTFSYLDAQNPSILAYYAAQSINPVIQSVTANYRNPVPATTNFTLSFQFDRSMNAKSTVAPVILLTNAAPGSVQAASPKFGSWTRSFQANDTYNTGPITFTNGMDGQVQVFISGAQDTFGRSLALTNPITLLVKSTPPTLPTVAILSPTNGASFDSSPGIVVTAAASSTNATGVTQVTFYNAGVFLGNATASPYTVTLPTNAGSYALTAVALDASNLMNTSAVVHVTINNPGSKLIDFEALNAAAGPVASATLSNYLQGFGVVASNVSSGSQLAVQSDTNVFNGSLVRATSGDNLLTQSSTNSKASFTLGFAQPYAGVSWMRPALLAGHGGVIAPQWRAHAFDATGAELGSVGESQVITFSDIPARPFTLVGPNISSIRFDANNTIGAFANLPLDDLLLSSVEPGATLSVELSTSATGTLTAPATVTLTADASIQGGEIATIDFYENGNYLDTIAGDNGSVTLNNLAPGTFSFTAVATDTNANTGSAITRSSAPAVVTVAAQAGVSVINFDALDASGGAVGGVALSNYLAGFGVAITNATLGSRVEAVNDSTFASSAAAMASSLPNLLTQDGLNTPVSFSFVLASAAQSVSFTRAALVAGPAGVIHPQWTAHIFDAKGLELESVTEPLLNSRLNVPARTFTLSGTNIHSIRFDSDSQGTASFSAVLLDDLIISNAPVTPALAVSLSASGAPFTALISPINLTANVRDSGSVDHVEFYSGADLIGVAYSIPYSITWNSVLAGVYSLTAKLVDAAGYAVVSAPLQVTVNPGSGSSAIVNFDSLNASKAAVSGAPLTTYLANNHIKVSAISPGTTLTVQNQANVARGNAVTAPSAPNLLTQAGSNGPVSFTLQFSPWLTQFNFTRPQLNENPFVSHPGWQALAYDALGVLVASVQESPVASFTNVPAQTFVLSGPGIASIEFDSQGTALTTFGAALFDDFILTTGAAASLPPAIAITNPLPGEIYTAPAVIPISAVTATASGTVTNVQFYSGSTLLGADTASPFTFQWTNNDSGAFALTAVATADSGMVRTSPVVNITVNPAPGVLGILSPPVSQVAGPGDSVDFSVVATASGPISYQWNKNGRPITGPGATAQDYAIFPVTADSVGSYSVTVSSGGAFLTTDPATLSVPLPPSITQQPASQTRAIGDAVVLSVRAQGDPPINYQWSLNGTPIAGATNQDYTIAAAQPLDSGNYQATVGNSYAFAQSGIATLSVRSAGGLTASADYFTNRASFDPLVGPVFGSNVGATSEPGEPKHDGKPGGASIWYTWHATFTGVISLTTRGSSFDTLLAVYTGLNITNLTLVAADDDSGGFFTSLVTFNVTEGTDYQIAVDGFQGATGDVVLGLPSGTGYRVLNPSGGGAALPVITRQPTNQIVKLGATAKLAVTAVSGTPLTYQWYFGNGPISGANASSLTITNFQGPSVGVYRVLVNNSVGSVQSAQASLDIGADTQGAGGSAAYGSEDKFGDAVDLSQGVGGAAPHVEPLAAGDTRGFSVSQVFSTVGATKEPGEPNHCGQPGGASQWYAYTTPTDGTMHVDTGGSSFNTILAVYSGAGTSFASLSAVACGYTTNYLKQGQPSLSIPMAANTRYFIVVDGYKGVSGTASLHVNIGKLPQILSAPSATPAGPSGTATFSVSATGTTNLFYQWQFNGVMLRGANKPTLVVSNAQNISAGAYSVIVSNVVGVVTSPPATLFYTTAPLIKSVTTNVTATVGKNATLSVTAVGQTPLSYQWYKNGAKIPGATKAALGFAPTQFTDSGSFIVVVSNSKGVASNAVAATLNVREAAPPTVAITSPTNRFSTTNPAVTVKGTAIDAYGVASVQLTVNSIAAAVTGTKNWSAPVALAPGTNIVVAQSANLSALLSQPQTNLYFYAVKSPLTLLTSGSGAISNIPAPAKVMIGQRYVLTAIPGASNIFHDWSSGPGAGALSIASYNAQLSFFMSPGLTLQATFISNPFPAVAGTYNGLFYPSASVTAQNSGFVTLTIGSASKGAFSGKLTLGGVGYPFTGAFNGAGDSTVAVARAGATAITLSLHINLSPGDDQITGAAGTPYWSASLVADRAVFSAANPTTAFAGVYTMAIPPGPLAPSNQPAGYGYLTMSNSPAGKANITGALADSAPVGQNVAISGEGFVPLYASLYGGSGSLLGWLGISNITAQVSGAVNWIRPAIATSAYFKGGFAYQTNVIGSALPKLPGGVLTSSSSLIISESDWAGPLAYEVGVTNYAVTKISGPTNGMAVTISPVTGIVTVTFRPTGAKASLVAKGVALQQQQNALGWFTNSGKSGFFLLH